MLNFNDFLATLNEADQAILEERAAIIEYDGKLPRAEAEQLAAMDFFKQLYATASSTEVSKQDY